MFSLFFQNNFDQLVRAFFLAERSDLGIKIFEIISFFGNWQFLIPAILLIVIILVIQKQKNFIWPFILTVASAEFITFLGKLYFARLRPLAATLSLSDFSFPSGHATIAVSFYGYLAFLLTKLVCPKYKFIIVSSAVLIAFLIGLSRLYLGVHYFSDVIGGYFIGVIALIIGIKLTKTR